jgi:predicted site-specific integrase-resolvase
MITQALETATPGESAAGFINERELLKRLPVSRRTLFCWRESGKIPCVRLPGSRRVLFFWPDVQQALRRRQKEVQP